MGLGLLLFFLFLTAAALTLAAKTVRVVPQATVMLDRGDPAQYLITQRYIESLKEMSKGNNSKVIFMPVETSTMLSSGRRRLRLKSRD